MRTLIILSFCLSLLSCEKKELPVAKQDRGDIVTTQIEMKSDYRNQVWYSLHDDKVVSVNLKTDWDLAFEASASGFHVMLNGAKSMKIYKTGFTALAQVTDTSGLGTGSKADMPGGSLDSTAIGNWQADNKVYVLNRGYNEAGLQLGFYKLKIKSVTATAFTFEYGDIYGSSTSQGMVNKDEAYNFIMYSFTDNMQKYIEPKRTEYDLCFTQYTHIFLDPFQYYQVTGVLCNNYNTRVAKIMNKPFTDIAIADTLNASFKTRKDIIGYDWKTFNLNTNIYTVDPAMCYIIEDNKGFYYKLHFIDFVNSSGIKGFPKFEFKKL